MQLMSLPGAPSKEHSHCFGLLANDRMCAAAQGRDACRSAGTSLTGFRAFAEENVNVANCYFDLINFVWFRSTTLSSDSTRNADVACYQLFHRQE